MPTTLDKKIRNKIQDQKFQANNPHIPNSVDTYTKWAPFVSVFLSDVAGIKTKNNWTQQILLMACSQALRTLITRPLKKITHEERPRPFMHKNSFPSGHTSTAFAGAEILRMELKDNYPALSYCGYAAATATALLRLYNNKHWFSDVVAGAAIGIISTRIVYFLLERKRKDQHQQSRKGIPNNSILIPESP